MSQIPDPSLTPNPTNPDCTHCFPINFCRCSFHDIQLRLPNARPNYTSISSHNITNLSPTSTPTSFNSTMGSLALPETTANAIETFKYRTRHLAEELQVTESGLDDLRRQALRDVNELYSDVAKTIVVLIPERPEFGPESALNARLSPQLIIVLAAAFDSLVPKSGSANVRTSLLAIADAFPQHGEAKSMATFGKNLIPRHATTIHDTMKKLNDNTAPSGTTPIQQMLRIVDALNQARNTRLRSRRSDIFYTKSDLTTAATSLLNPASSPLQIRPKKKALLSQKQQNASTKNAPATTLPVKQNNTSTTGSPFPPHPKTHPANNGWKPINDVPKLQLSTTSTASNPSSYESGSDSNYDPPETDTRQTNQQTNSKRTVDKISSTGSQNNRNPNIQDHDTDDDVVDRSIKRRRGLHNPVQQQNQGMSSTPTYINPTSHCSLLTQRNLELSETIPASSSATLPGQNEDRLEFENEHNHIEHDSLPTDIRLIYPPPIPEPARSSTYTHDPTMKKMMDIQLNINELPEYQAFIEDAKLAANNPRWDGTHNESYAKFVANTFHLGYPPKIWTMGSPGAPDFPKLPHPHPVTRTHYKDADVLLLTSAQHGALLETAYALDKCVVLREPDVTAAHVQYQSLQHKLLLIDIGLNIAKTVCAKNYTTSEVSVQDTQALAVGPDGKPTSVCQTMSITKATNIIKRSITTGDYTSFNTRPPSNFIDLDGTTAVIPESLQPHTKMTTDIWAVLQMFRDPSNRGYRNVSVAAKTSTTATEVNKLFELIGQRGTVSLPHMDMAGALTFATLQPNSNSWRRTLDSPSQSYKLWPVIPASLRTPSEMRKIYGQFANKAGGKWISKHKCTFPLILLMTGDTLIMPPGTIHFPASLTTCYMTGGMAWSHKLLPQTIDFWAYAALNNDTVTNEDPPPTTIPIIHILTDYITRNPVTLHSQSQFTSVRDMQTWINGKLDTIRQVSLDRIAEEAA